MIDDVGRRVLLATSSEKGKEFFCKILGNNSDADFVSSGAEARRRLNERDYDVVVINCPLKDEFGTELAETVIKDTYAGVIALVKADVYENVTFVMEKIGVYCIPKPVSAQAFAQGLNLATATNKRLYGLIKKTQSLKEKMEEIKLVGRAKLLLITKLSLSETEAHKYIEKQAMDRCVKRSVVASDVIKLYGD